MTRVIKRRPFLVTAVLLTALLLTLFIVDRIRTSDPSSNFVSISGRGLPLGVTATHYGHRITDNVLHRTHYWILQGDADALRSIVDGTGFKESEDAAYMLPDLKELFGLPLVESDVVAGFEWELDRDRWFCIFEGHRTALYSH